MRKYTGRYNSGRRVEVPKDLPQLLESYMNRNSLTYKQVASMCLPDENGKLPEPQSIGYFARRKSLSAGVLFIESIKRIVESDLSAKPFIPSTDYIVWSSAGDNTWKPKYLVDENAVKDYVVNAGEVIVTKVVKVTRKVVVELV